MSYGFEAMTTVNFNTLPVNKKSTTIYFLVLDYVCNSHIMTYKHRQIGYSICDYDNFAPTRSHCKF